MPKTKVNQKSTAMDYLSAPRSEGLVVSLLSLLGFTAGDGGRLPQGLKYDTLKAMRDVFSSDVGTETAQIIGARVCELQADRKTASPRISASPESLMNAVKAGKLSLDQLKEAIAGLEG
tara:strand:- start:216 stop:572 length:357 start_codon:yes stop_codon:yes gene_type:complete